MFHSTSVQCSHCVQIVVIGSNKIKKTVPKTVIKLPDMKVLKVGRMTENQTD